MTFLHLYFYCANKVQQFVTAALPVTLSSCGAAHLQFTVTTEADVMETYCAHFQIQSCCTTRMGLHALILKKSVLIQQHYNPPCLRSSILAPVSLRSPSKASSLLCTARCVRLCHVFSFKQSINLYSNGANSQQK